MAPTAVDSARNQSAAKFQCEFREAIFRNGRARAINSYVNFRRMSMNEQAADRVCEFMWNSVPKMRNYLCIDPTQNANSISSLKIYIFLAKKETIIVIIIIIHLVKWHRNKHFKMNIYRFFGGSHNCIYDLPFATSCQPWYNYGPTCMWTCIQLKRNRFLYPEHGTARASILHVKRSDIEIAHVLPFIGCYHSQVHIFGNAFWIFRLRLFEFLPSEREREMAVIYCTIQDAWRRTRRWSRKTKEEVTNLRQQQQCESRTVLVRTFINREKHETTFR